MVSSACNHDLSALSAVSLRRRLNVKYFQLKYFTVMCKENLYPVECVVVKYLSENVSSPLGKWYFHMAYVLQLTQIRGLQGAGRKCSREKSIVTLA